jgi:hypothetical protein
MRVDLLPSADSLCLFLTLARQHFKGVTSRTTPNLNVYLYFRRVFCPFEHKKNIKMSCVLTINLHLLLSAFWGKTKHRGRKLQQSIVLPIHNLQPVACHAMQYSTVTIASYQLTNSCVLPVICCWLLSEWSRWTTKVF